MRYSPALRALRAPTQPLLSSCLLGHLSGSGGLRKTSIPAAVDILLRRPSSSASAGDLVEQHETVNPPASTRPPPLETPVRDPAKSLVGHWFQVGKAYVKFYKAGLYAVGKNRNLLREALAQRAAATGRPSVFRPRDVPADFTRSDWVLLWRVRHDLARVPLFGLVLLICGEFTPLVVAFVNGVVPYTCRLPSQVQGAFSKAEERRHASFRDLENRFPEGVTAAPKAVGAAQAHVLRSLHLISTVWDRINVVPPGLWPVKGNLRMAFLEGDDRLLVKAGGVAGLHPDEVRVACSERGIDVVGRGVEELKVSLGDWLRLTAAEDPVENRKRMTVLLSTRQDKWPTSRDFRLPEWHL